MEYKPLSTDFMLKGFRHTQLRREKDIAIFHKVAVEGPLHPRPFDAGFEVVIVSRHDGYELAGVKMEPAETYPSNEQWGTKGWTCSDLFHAELKFDELTGKTPAKSEAADIKETPREPKVVRHRTPQPDLLIPVGEFSTRDLAEQNHVDYPVAVGFLKEKLALNAIQFSREERRSARGPMTKLFKKA